MTLSKDQYAGIRCWVTPIIVIAIAVAMHGLAGQFLGEYAQKVMIDCGIAVIAAVSLTVVNGFTGQFSIGHAAFIAIGSYVAGSITYYILLATTGDSISEPTLLGYRQFLLAGSCLVAGVVAAAVGFFVGLPSLRLKGDYLAIVTLGFGEIVRVFLQQTNPQIFADQWDAAVVPILNPPLGGSLGFVNLPKLTNLFWLMLFVLGTLLLAYRLKYSTHGRAMIAIREDETAAQSMGVNVTKLKVMAFMFAAFFGGIAGGLYAHSGATLRPVDAGFIRSFDVVMMVVLGGLGSISGAAIAAVIVIAAGEWLREPTHVWHIGLGLLAMRGVMAMVLPSWRAGLVKSVAWIVGFIVAIEVVRDVAIRMNVELGSYRMVLFALVLILLMIFRPNGLLGIHEIWEWVRGGQEEKR
jgi:branched-chain amino acid transport system permease protein